MKTKAILFDLGGVLIDWNPSYLFRRLLPDPEKREHFLQTVCTNEWNAAQDGGRSLQQGTAMLVAQHPQWQPYIEAYYQHWDEMVAGTIAGSVELLRKLRRQPSIELYALTNSSAELFPRLRQRFGFLSWFNGIVVSGEEGMRKPSAAFFELALKRYGLQAGSVLFVDDSPVNVKAALAMGIDSIRFQNSTQLEQELAKRALLNKDSINAG